jgi:erythromycin esterase
MPQRLISALEAILAASLLAAGGCSVSAGPYPTQNSDSSKAASEWIAKNAIPLTTTEPGHGIEDLLPIRGIVGDARVVALGEATHGTREFFRLKHRLLEFLVSEMGFTAFAIEATMPESFDVDRYVLRGEGDPARALSGLYGWTWDTEEVLDLIRWMRAWNADPKHARKIHFYGFDPQSGPRATLVALKYVGRVDREWARSHTGALAALTNPWFSANLAGLPSERAKSLQAAADEVVAAFDHRRRAWIARSSEDEWSLARQHARLLTQFLEIARPDHPVTTRDKAMSENVQWILDREGSEGKVVVWAHNLHVGRVEGRMGSFLAKALGERLVIFGFAFDRGSFQAMDFDLEKGGGLQIFTVAAAPEDSLDAVLETAGLPVAVIDLRRLPESEDVRAWLAAPRPTRFASAVFTSAMNSRFLRVNAAECYDALVFVSETTAARANPGGRRFSEGKAGAPRNLDFEAGEPGEAPPGWSRYPENTAFGFLMETVSGGAHGGSRCARIRRAPGEYYGETFGEILQLIDPSPYRGKTLVIRAWIRTDAKDAEAGGYLWLTGSGSDGASTYFETMADNPIRNREWREVRIRAPIPNDESELRLGFAFTGTGGGWIDDVRLETAGSSDKEAQ